MNRQYVGFFALLASLMAGCATSVTVRYQQRGYVFTDDHAVKRLVVAAWEPQDTPGFAVVASRVGSDLVRLRKTYIVFPPYVFNVAWNEACIAKEGSPEGVLALIPLDIVQRSPQNPTDPIDIKLTAGLYRCSDGQLLWQADGEATWRSLDKNLVEFTSNYIQELGEPAARFAAPLFGLLQAMIGKLPEPVLNDDEVLEKIDMDS